MVLLSALDSHNSLEEDFDNTDRNLFIQVGRSRYFVVITKLHGEI